MRKLIAAVAFLCFAAFSFAQTATVSGHIITGQNGTSSSGISVPFELVNDNGQQCKVAGVGLIMPMTLTFTQAQLAAGVSLITNSAITCGTTTGGTRWRYTIKSGGTGTRQCSLNITGATNLDSAVCLNATSTPVTTTPTDSIYARLDGTNAGFTGNTTHNSHDITGIGTLGATTISGSPVFSGSTTVGKFNNAIYVDGTKYPLTQTGIQSAFTDACAITGGPGPGADVYFPPMSVSLVLTSGQQFTVTCNLHLHGAGDYSTRFLVAAGVGVGVPTFRFKPNNVAAQSDILIEGIEVTSADGISGGDAFLFDGTGAGISGPNNSVVRKNRVHGLNVASWAINMSGTGSTQNGWNVVENNTFTHGINLAGTLAVDSWLIMHNVFGSDTGNTQPCINADTIAGGSHITVFNNNGGCLGGFFISHGTTQCKIIYNQIEQPGTSTEANSAIIDLQGNTYSIDGCEIVGNNINAHTFATRNIRLGIATNTSIYDNVIAVKATTGIGIDIVSATTTRLPFNEFTGTGGGAVAVNNPGNATNISARSSDGSAVAPAYSFLNNTDRGWFNTSGAMVEAFGGVDIRAINGGGDIVGSAMGRCFGANTDPLNGTFDTCLSRNAAGVVSTDTTTIGNGAGSLKTTNATLKRVLVIGTAPTCSVTGAGAGATCTVTAGSTDSGGQMNINSGTGPGSSGTITLTFSSSFGANASACAMNLANGAAGWNARASLIGNGSSTSTAPFSWDNNAVTITASQSGTLAVTYWCSGR